MCKLDDPRMPTVTECGAGLHARGYPKILREIGVAKNDNLIDVACLSIACARISMIARPEQCAFCDLCAL